MIRFLLSGPILIVWLGSSIACVVLGMCFGGSWRAFADYPSPLVQPLSFLAWAIATAVIFAPLVLILTRLFGQSRIRGFDAQD
jgi:pilus assembly protein TadC